jgi:hypothetical protein
MSCLNLNNEENYTLRDIFYLKRDEFLSIVQDRTIFRDGKKICSEKYLVQPPYDFVVNLINIGFKTISVLDYDLEPFVYHNGMNKEAEGIIYVSGK